MEYVHAALLLNKAGKEVNEENLTNVLESADIEVDEAQVKSLMTALEDVDIEEAIEQSAVPAAPAQQTAEASSEESEASDEDASSEDDEDSGDDSEPEGDGADDEEAAEGLGELF